MANLMSIPRIYNYTSIGKHGLFIIENRALLGDGLWFGDTEYVDLCSITLHCIALSWE